MPNELGKRVALMDDAKRQRLIEDKKALQDAIKTALALGDTEEVNRLTKHLEWLENYLKEVKK